MSRACIPFHILFDKDLSKNELLIYGLIEHMESDGKHVFFNNRSIAKKLGVSHESRIVGKMLIKLKEKGYITRIQKEITFNTKHGERKEIRWCFNTVKKMVIPNLESEDDSDLPLVPEIPPITLVAEIPSPLVPEIPPYNTPDLNNPLTTTTTCSSGFFVEETEKEILELREKHIKNDDRTPVEFLSQCKWHLKHGDQKYSEVQRLGGLKKLIKSGYFEKPGNYPTQNVQHQENLLWSQYQSYLKSPVEKMLIEKGAAVLLEFSAWKAKHVQG